MTALLKQKLEGIAILALLAVAAAAILWAVAEPVLEKLHRVQDIEIRLSRFQNAVASGAEVVRVDVSAVISSGVASDQHALDIQRGLVEDSQAAGLLLGELSVLPERVLEPGMRQMRFHAASTGDLAQLTKFLTQLGERRPALFLDRLEVQAGTGSRPDQQLTVKIEISSYVQAAAP
jgi:hypothetical protein